MDVPIEGSRHNSSTSLFPGGAFKQTDGKEQAVLSSNAGQEYIGLTGSNPARSLQQRRLSISCRSCRRASHTSSSLTNRGECGRNYKDLLVAGSSPASGFDAGVAQSVEQRNGFSHGFFNLVAAVGGAGNRWSIRTAGRLQRMPNGTTFKMRRCGFESRFRSPGRNGGIGRRDGRARRVRVRQFHPSCR